MALPRRGRGGGGGERDPQVFVIFASTMGHSSQKTELLSFMCGQAHSCNCIPVSTKYAPHTFLCRFTKKKCIQILSYDMPWVFFFSGRNPFVVSSCSNRMVNSSDQDCLSYASFSPVLYLNVPQLLQMTWVGSDAESGIFDYQVSLWSVSSTPPARRLFSSTVPTEEFVRASIADLQQDSVTYVEIVATNNAQLRTTALLGPLVVDLTPPTFTGSVQVSGY